MEEGLIKNLITYLIVGATMLLEEFIKHPIGSIAAILGILYTYERIKTQRLISKREKIGLENDKKRYNGSTIKGTKKG